MFRNYIRISWRTLWRHRGTTAINLLGLSVSLAVCFLASVFVHEQWSMDRFHPGADRIHYLASSTPRFEQLNGTTPAPLAPALRASYPGAEAATRLAHMQEAFVVHDGASINASVVYADSAFFDVFSGFKLQAGNRATALSGRRTAVVTAEAARRIFGSADVVGKTFQYKGEYPYTVTGVLASTEEPTHLDRDIFLAYATVADKPTAASWGDIWNSHWTYVRLREGQSAADLTEAATSLFQRNVPQDKREGIGLVVQSLNDLRFGGTTLNPLSIRTQIPSYFYGFFLGLAVAVLLAAGFNYVNLTTAHSLQRAKEIGVRKAVGANRGQLALQFLGESVVACLLGSLGAFAILTFLLPAFNNLYLWNLLELPALSGEVWTEPVLLTVLFGITLLFGLAAGAYPALVLSRSKPKEVMGFSPSVARPFGSLSLRKVLIGAQFGFALVLLVTATTLYRQSAKMTSTAFDLKTDRMVAVDLQDVALDRFRRAAERDPNVAAVAGLDLLPMSTGWDTDPVRIDPDDTPVQIYRYDADTTFVQDMGLSLEAARPDWRVTYSSGDGVLINETAAHDVGFETAAEAVGATMYRGDPSDGDDVIPYTVVGVVDNFAFTGAGQIYTGRSRRTTPPLFFRADTGGYNWTVIRARTADLAALRDRLEAMWTQDLQTDYPFTSRFYSELTQERNGPMQDLSSIAGFMAFLAILITLLGLLSIAAHTVQTRTKEIGIRKALGATLSGLVVLLSRDFVGLVGAAVITALPVAWWLNVQWLQFVPDPVSMGPGSMLVTAALLLLAVLTVASQTLRAARLDPATTLRDE